MVTCPPRPRIRWGTSTRRLRRECAKYRKRTRPTSERTHVKARPLAGSLEPGLEPPQAAPAHRRPRDRADPTGRHLRALRDRGDLGSHGQVKAAAKPRIGLLDGP